MKLLIAQPVVEKLDAQTRMRAQVFLKRNRRQPKLVAVWVGDAPESKIYVLGKKRRAESLGLAAEIIQFSASVSPQKVKAAIAALNRSSKVDGILLQRPLPPQFKNEDVERWIDPKKDVDCFHPENFGKLVLGLPGLKPCTPLGILALLQHYQIPIAGRRAVVVGRSPLVGQPTAQLLLRQDATVTIAHSKTIDLASITRNANILIVAAGQRGLIQKQHVAPQTTVIDVGIHRDPSSAKIKGDVDTHSLRENAAALSPVPGGVGPLTISFLMQNTMQAAEDQQKPARKKSSLRRRKK